MQLQTTSSESKFLNEYISVIFIQIDQHLKKLLKKYKGVLILWNTVYKYTKYALYMRSLGRNPSRQTIWCILALKSDIWWQQFCVMAKVSGKAGG